jgi:hypothetical protein
MKIDRKLLQEEGGLTQSEIVAELQEPMAGVGQAVSRPWYLAAKRGCR